MVQGEGQEKKGSEENGGSMTNFEKWKQNLKIEDLMMNSGSLELSTARNVRQKKPAR